MPQVTAQHLEQLIVLESQVHYHTSPPQGEPTFVTVVRDAPVLISAPHGAATFRNSVKQVWHIEDEYTAGMALLLGQLCQVPVIATVWKNSTDDPNYTVGRKVPYKEWVLAQVKAQPLRFVLDLHGASQHTPVLEPLQTIDLGFRISPRSAHKPSMQLTYIERLEALFAEAGRCSTRDCFVVGRNHFAAASAGTITTLAAHAGAQALQIELKPPLRVARRLPTAVLYSSEGPYQADPHCLLAALQALVDFIEFLKQVDQGDQTVFI